jgi:hypothetical protein
MNPEKQLLEYPISLEYNNYYEEISQNLKQDNQRPNSLQVINFNWVDCLEKKISNHEQMQIKLNRKKFRVNSNPTKANSSHAAANATCKECKCKASYSFSVEQKPANQAPFTFIMNVKRIGEHQHLTSTKTQHIRGDLREQIATRNFI